MKFRVTATTTESLTHAVNGEVFQDGQNAPDVRARAILDMCERWFEDRAVVVLEVDTESDTCVVVPVIEK